MHDSCNFMKINDNHRTYRKSTKRNENHFKLTTIKWNLVFPLPWIVQFAPRGFRNSKFILNTRWTSFLANIQPPPCVHVFSRDGMQKARRELSKTSIAQLLQLFGVNKRSLCRLLLTETLHFWVLDTQHVFFAIHGVSVHINWIHRIYTPRQCNLQTFQTQNNYKNKNTSRTQHFAVITNEIQCKSMDIHCNHTCRTISSPNMQNRFHLYHANLQLLTPLVYGEIRNSMVYSMSINFVFFYISFTPKNIFWFNQPFCTMFQWFVSSKLHGPIPHTAVALDTGQHGQYSPTLKK